MKRTAVALAIVACVFGLVLVKQQEETRAAEIMKQEQEQRDAELFK